MNFSLHRKSTLLLIWLAAVTALTFPLFAWQLDYFRRPGPGYHGAFLALAGVLLLGGFLYARVRPRVARFEPFLFGAIPVSLGLFQDARSTVVVLLLIASAYTLGGGLFRLLSLDAEFAIETALGLGLLMSLFVWLGMAGILYWQVVLLVLLFPLVLFPKQWKRLRPSPQVASISIWSSLAVVFGLVFVTCSSAVMIAPALAFDVIHVHLPCAQYYASQHRVAPLPLIPYSFFPQGAETLMAAGLTLAGQTAAQAIPVLFFGLAVLLCRAFAREFGLDSSGAWMAALCAGALPFANWAGSAGKNDLALACFEFASLYCLIRWSATRAINWILAGAAFLGFACSIKYVVLYGAPPLVLLLLHACWRERRWKTLLASVALTAIFGLLWPLRAWILTGNPVFPEHLGRSGSIQLAKAALPWTGKLLAFLATPWTVHFHSVFASPLRAPAGILLVLFLPVWFLGWRKGNSAARYCFFFAGFYWLYWSAIWPVLRFGVAPLMVLSVLTVACLFSFYTRATFWPRVAINAALAYSLLFSLTGTMIMEINAPQLRFLAGRITGTEYLREVLPSFASLQFLGREAASSDLVFAVGNCSVAYSPFPWNYDCLSARAPLETIRAHLGAFPFRYLILPAGFPAPVALDQPDYQDSSYAVYRLPTR